MVIIFFLYLAMIFVLLNLIVQVFLYLKDVKERLNLRASLRKQVKPKEADVKLARVGKIHTSSG